MEDVECSLHLQSACIYQWRARLQDQNSIVSLIRQQSAVSLKCQWAHQHMDRCKTVETSIQKDSPMMKLKNNIIVLPKNWELSPLYFENRIGICGLIPFHMQYNAGSGIRSEPTLGLESWSIIDSNFG